MYVCCQSRPHVIQTNFIGLFCYDELLWFFIQRNLILTRVNYIEVPFNSKINYGCRLLDGGHCSRQSLLKLAIISILKDFFSDKNSGTGATSGAI